MEKTAGIGHRRLGGLGRLGLVLVAVMGLAFFFGFMKSLWGVDYERLHIFLFNLTCGGFLVLYYTEGEEGPGPRSLAFFLLSIVYALLAYFELYAAAIPLSLVMAALVESLRIERFSFFPADFFKKDADVSRKFHQASLLCLSLALVISSLVILNDQYYHWIFIRKLTLNVFFLGFSFPVSLITLSIMFSFVDSRNSTILRVAEQVLFWMVNCGVILFFIFILLEWAVFEVVTASLLAVAVACTFFFFFRYGSGRQQKHFLVSGMVFLLFTAVTGIAYIAVRMGGGEAAGALLLRLHSYLSLYGWNLSGMMVILRWNDFPLRLNSFGALALHWITVGLLAPAGVLSPLLAVAATALFIIFLAFFSQTR